MSSARKFHPHTAAIAAGADARANGSRLQQRRWAMGNRGAVRGVIGDATLNRRGISR